jgi:small subunit ribosomal protein S18
MRRNTKPERGARRSRARGDELAPRRRSRHLDGVIRIPINDHDFMQRMMTEHGKILPSRLTGATAKQQRRIRRGIRRLRTLGLVP